jgi:hypothetical protein
MFYQALFPQQENRGDSPFDVMNDLQAHYTYMAHMESIIVALYPAAQALHDKDFVDAATFILRQVERQSAWSKAKIKVKGPQTLIVPAHTE